MFGSPPHRPGRREGSERLRGAQPLPGVTPGRTPSSPVCPVTGIAICCSFQLLPCCSCSLCYCYLDVLAYTGLREALPVNCAHSRVWWPQKSEVAETSFVLRSTGTALGSGAQHYETWTSTSLWLSWVLNMYEKGEGYLGRKDVGCWGFVLRSF